MEKYRDPDTAQVNRVRFAAERLEEGEILTKRSDGTVVAARKRDRGDFVVARSKNGTTQTEQCEDASTAASKFDRHAFA